MFTAAATALIGLDEYILGRLDVKRRVAEFPAFLPTIGPRRFSEQSAVECRQCPVSAILLCAMKKAGLAPSVI